MDEVVNMCAVNRTKCQGVCLSVRSKRGFDFICPALYQKVVVRKQERARYTDSDLMEQR